ncbi:flagellar hook-length control protein FliK [Psychromarinibacter sp. S121]|uniref:flagellar hook-length control protein FliK n=1 Tax=Psychromarinibacter sp. S121 TaxID=3415127 RepID=UPI003C7A0E98
MMQLIQMTEILNPAPGKGAARLTGGATEKDTHAATPFSSFLMQDESVGSDSLGEGVEGAVAPDAARVLAGTSVNDLDLKSLGKHRTIEGNDVEVTPTPAEVNREEIPGVDVDGFEDTTALSKPDKSTESIISIEVEINTEPKGEVSDRIAESIVAVVPLADRLATGATALGVATDTPGASTGSGQVNAGSLHGKAELTGISAAPAKMAGEPDRAVNSARDPDKTAYSDKLPNTATATLPVSNGLAGISLVDVESVSETSISANPELARSMRSQTVDGLAAESPRLVDGKVPGGDASKAGGVIEPLRAERPARTIAESRSDTRPGQAGVSALPAAGVDPELNFVPEQGKSDAPLPREPAPHVVPAVAPVPGAPAVLPGSNRRTAQPTSEGQLRVESAAPMAPPAPTMVPAAAGMPSVLPAVSPPQVPAEMERGVFSVSPDGPAMEMSAASSPEERTLPLPATRIATDPALPRQLAIQLLEAARGNPDRPVELVLEPVELGRVRMTMAGSEGAMQVSLAVERSETAELLRRHIETLAQEFRQLGYRDVSFRFSGEGTSANGGQGFAGGGSGGGAPDMADTAEPAPVRITLTDRMDIRL